jgi:REP element-mobilizing transposase RayT
MPIPNKYLVDFVENNIYHVYNRTNNKEKLFVNDGNRLFFLKQYAKYISPIADTFCWCLLPNHFHFLIRVKPEEEIVNSLKSRAVRHSDSGNLVLNKTEKAFLGKVKNLSELIEFYFKSFFQSYSLAFNKANNRSGNLFHSPFKRIEILKESQFTQTIVYIHANPFKHKIINDFTKYDWSSYKSFFSNKPTLLCKQEILDWFGSLNKFEEIHLANSAYYYNTDILIED